MGQSISWFRRVGGYFSVSRGPLTLPRAGPAVCSLNAAHLPCTGFSLETIQAQRLILSQSFAVVLIFVLPRCHTQRFASASIDDASDKTPRGNTD